VTAKSRRCGSDRQVACQAWSVSPVMAFSFLQSRQEFCCNRCARRVVLNRF
jgi:hypothetical protein